MMVWVHTFPSPFPQLSHTPPPSKEIPPSHLPSTAADAAAVRNTVLAMLVHSNMMVLVNALLLVLCHLAEMDTGQLIQVLIQVLGGRPSRCQVKLGGSWGEAVGSCMGGRSGDQYHFPCRAYAHALSSLISPPSPPTLTPPLTPTSRRPGAALEVVLPPQGLECASCVPPHRLRNSCFLARLLLT